MEGVQNVSAYNRVHNAQAAGLDEVDGLMFLSKPVECCLDVIRFKIVLLIDELTMVCLPGGFARIRGA